MESGNVFSDLSSCCMPTITASEMHALVISQKKKCLSVLRLLKLHSQNIQAFLFYVKSRLEKKGMQEENDHG